MSVLETHHCSRAITLLSVVENDILAGLNDKQHGELWKMLISCILATDMALHFVLIGQFEGIVQGKVPFNKENFDHKKLIASMILKCADISNVVKPFQIAKKWAEILCNEFFLQGDIERAKGLEVSPLMDRDSVVMPQMQLGFINSICFPIFSIRISIKCTAYQNIYVSHFCARASNHSQHLEEQCTGMECHSQTRNDKGLKKACRKVTYSVKYAVSKHQMVSE
jgi:hypothetical protein